MEEEAHEEDWTAGGYVGHRSAGCPQAWQVLHCKHCLNVWPGRWHLEQMPGVWPGWIKIAGPPV